jgi:hypothetical protein
MPQLRSCYFCGSVGDSLREYEVVPERLVADGESRSAVLCSDCREKLRRVLEPLVESAESAATGGPDHGTAAIGEVTFESGDATVDDEATTRTTATTRTYRTATTRSSASSRTASFPWSGPT